MRMAHSNHFSRLIKSLWDSPTYVKCTLNSHTNCIANLVFAGKRISLNIFAVSKMTNDTAKRSFGRKNSRSTPEWNDSRFESKHTCVSGRSRNVDVPYRIDEVKQDKYLATLLYCNYQ